MNNIFSSSFRKNVSPNNDHIPEQDQKSYFNGDELRVDHSNQRTNSQNSHQTPTKEIKLRPAKHSVSKEQLSVKIEDLANDINNKNYEKYLSFWDKFCVWLSTMFGRVFYKKDEYCMQELKQFLNHVDDKAEFTEALFNRIGQESDETKKNLLIQALHSILISGDEAVEQWVKDLFKDSLVALYSLDQDANAVPQAILKLADFLENLEKDRTFVSDLPGKAQELLDKARNEIADKLIFGEMDGAVVSKFLKIIEKDDKLLYLFQAKKLRLEKMSNDGSSLVPKLISKNDFQALKNIFEKCLNKAMGEFFDKNIKKLDTKIKQTNIKLTEKESSKLSEQKKVWVDLKNEHSDPAMLTTERRNQLLEKCSILLQSGTSPFEEVLTLSTKFLFSEIENSGCSNKDELLTVMYPQVGDEEAECKALEILNILCIASNIICQCNTLDLLANAMDSYDAQKAT